MAPDLSDQERALLSRCPLFLGVEDALLRSLPALPGVTVEPFAAGEVLYGPGQFRQSLGVILSGQVQVTNGSLSVSLLRAGELFGAAALYNDAPEFAAVLKAQSPCRVLFLPQETLDRLLRNELKTDEDDGEKKSDLFPLVAALFNRGKKEGTE